MRFGNEVHAHSACSNMLCASGTKLPAFGSDTSPLVEVMLVTVLHKNTSTGDPVFVMEIAQAYGFHNKRKPQHALSSIRVSLERERTFSSMYPYPVGVGTDVDKAGSRIRNSRNL